jgi:hypothetical protein
VSWVCAGVAWNEPLSERDDRDESERVESEDREEQEPSCICDLGEGDSNFV